MIDPGKKEAGTAGLGMGVHACIFSIWEAEAGGSLRVLDQPKKRRIEVYLD